MARSRVRRLIRRSRAVTVLQVFALTIVLVVTATWWSDRQDLAASLVAALVALVSVAMGAAGQLGDLRRFAGRVRARSDSWTRLDTGDIVVPEPERPAPATIAIVTEVTAQLGLPNGSVLPVVRRFDAHPDARDLPMAAVLPPSRGTTLVLIDDDLDEFVREAADGGRPYNTDPDEFLDEVHAVLAHELAHVQAWDTSARPVAHGLSQATPRFACASAVLVVATDALALAWVGGLVLVALAAAIASGRSIRGLTLLRMGGSAWAIAATALGALSVAQLVMLTIAAFVPTVVSAAFERLNEFYADRIAVAVAGDARPLARFLRRFPDYQPGIRVVVASHPSTRRRLGRLARMRA